MCHVGPGAGQCTCILNSRDNHSWKTQAGQSPPLNLQTTWEDGTPCLPDTALGGSSTGHGSTTASLTRSGNHLDSLVPCLPWLNAASRLCEAAASSVASAYSRLENAPLQIWEGDVGYDAGWLWSIEGFSVLPPLYWKFWHHAIPCPLLLLALGPDWHILVYCFAASVLQALTKKGFQRHSYQPHSDLDQVFF